ncbi:MAG: [FeFe] hydrogenase H-cluster radical SAM maturase HydE, partial [Clostridia bacterium]|nr:[FeFe] hydrogenase H-cluster radical SAM maturase HydE [Clostridia bacterium]
MNKTENICRIDRLASEHRLPKEDYLALILTMTDEEDAYLASRALAVRESVYGKKVFIRGLIEISNICKNDCYYCGIRASNKHCERYRLTLDDILACCDEGYALGFRTFVMQGGEDGYFTDDRLVPLIAEIKRRYPDCAVTLSLGERSCDSYKALREAGADRYLLRHETATPEHYRLLHPANLSWENRMACLENLRALGYQVGAGFMVGSPFQTADMLAEELCFIGRFKPDMCGIGPFIPHKDTDFADFGAGSVDLTCRLLSCIRLIHPTILLPATTALGSLQTDGRERGILHGANVVMPNLSPASVRKKYMLYDNKRSDGDESAQALDAVRAAMERIGYEVAVERGDRKAFGE